MEHSNIRHEAALVMIRKLLCSTAVVVVVVIAVACSGDGDDATTPAACSNGPAYDRAFQKYEQVYDTAEHVRCTPRCAYSGPPNGAGGGNWFYADALPSGACDGKGAPCSMNLGVVCCGEATRTGGPVHKMRCDCIDGNWKCTIAAAGGGACSCRDASADSATDSAPP